MSKRCCNNKQNECGRQYDFNPIGMLYLPAYLSLIRSKIGRCYEVVRLLNIYIIFKYGMLSILPHLWDSPKSIASNIFAILVNIFSYKSNQKVAI